MIRDLNRCEGCGRWVQNIFSHARCLPAVYALQDAVSYPERTTMNHPRRAVTNSHRVGQKLVLDLECGHLETRLNVSKIPNRTFCSQCPQELQ